MNNMNGVLRLLFADGAPFLFAAFMLLFQSNTVLSAENQIAVESRSVSGRTPYGLENDSDVMPGVSEMVPYQRPIEEGGTFSPGEMPEDMQTIEDQYQLQLIQREVMELRGLVEELSFQIDRMRITQEDRYLELDKRYQVLSQKVAGKGGARSSRLSTAGRSNGPQRRPVAGEGEKKVYETSLVLIQNKQYELAISQLQSVITDYPDGAYAPNAYYWLGEVYAAKPEPEYEKARKALAQVISFFPDHRKVPDAAFKLGKVYNLMGDCARATDILNQVIDQQRGKSVQKLAETYLRDQVNCDT